MHLSLTSSKISIKLIFEGEQEGQKEMGEFDSGTTSHLMASELTDHLSDFSSFLVGSLHHS